VQRANERVRSAWNRTPARSSPCVASPAAPSTTIATTLRRVRAWRRRLVALFAFVQRLTVMVFPPFLSRAPAAEVVGVSTAWLGKGLSCVCAQRRESDARLSFDLSPIQVKARSHYVLLLPISLRHGALATFLFFPVARDHSEIGKSLLNPHLSYMVYFTPKL